MKCRRPLRWGWGCRGPADSCPGRTWAAGHRGRIDAGPEVSLGAKSARWDWRVGWIRRLRPPVGADAGRPKETDPSRPIGSTTLRGTRDSIVSRSLLHTGPPSAVHMGRLLRPPLWGTTGIWPPGWPSLPAIGCCCAYLCLRTDAAESAGNVVPPTSTPSSLCKTQSYKIYNSFTACLFIHGYYFLPPVLFMLKSFELGFIKGPIRRNDKVLDLFHCQMMT